MPEPLGRVLCAGHRKSLSQGNATSASANRSRWALPKAWTRGGSSSASGQGAAVDAAAGAVATLALPPVAASILRDNAGGNASDRRSVVERLDSR